MTVAACRVCGRIMAVKAGEPAACPNCGWSSDARRATTSFLPYLRAGLVLVRAANAFSILLSVGMLGVQVCAVSAPGAVARYGLLLAAGLAIGLLLVLIGHLTGQFCCAAAPSSHGGVLALGSVLCVVFAGLLFACFALSGQLGLALIASGLAFLVAAALWLLFFGRLAAGLNDRKLRGATRALVAGCVLLFLVVGVLTARAMAADLARDRSEAIAWQLITGAGNIVLGVGYHFFLNIAVRAVSARLAQTADRN